LGRPETVKRKRGRKTCSDEERVGKYDEQKQSVETAEVKKEEERDSDRSMLHARLLGHYYWYPEMVIGVGSQGVKVCSISDCSHPSEARMAHC
jgi:hypothetical protein